MGSNWSSCSNTNICVGIHTITCKAHQMLWHCLFSTLILNNSCCTILTVNICCSAAVQYWNLSLWPSYIWDSLYLHSKCRVAEQQHSKSFPCPHHVGIHWSRCVAPLNHKSTLNRVVMSLTLWLIPQRSNSSASWIVECLFCRVGLYAVTVVRSCVTVTVFTWCVMWI